MWTRSLADEERGVWEEEGAGRRLGFVWSGPSTEADAEPDTGQVYAIYLEPDEIGRGLGRALFAKATEDLRLRGFRRATLWVLASNEPGRRFYEAAGWRPDGVSQTEEVRGAPIEEVRYAIDLGPEVGITGSPPAS